MPRDLPELWRLYADTGAGPDAPMYGDIARAVADDHAMIDLVRECPPETHHPNHLLAAVRFLLLGGVEHELAGIYSSGNRQAVFPAFRSFALEHREAILEVLQVRRVQTNEVGRIAVIAPALAHVQRQVGGAIGMVDVGCSAGLNLLVDRCRVSYGLFATGDAASPVQIDCEVATPPPRFDMEGLEISWRMGLDRSPVDLDDPDAARWLLACVWVEQAHRIERLTKAIDLARRYPATIGRGDAVEDLAQMVERVPPDLHPTVLTSWVAFYLSREQRTEFERVLGAVGRPVTWVSLEHPGVVSGLGQPPPPAHQETVPSVIGCVTFDGAGTRREFLGWAHPHGRWLDWCADAADGAGRAESATGSS